MLIYLAALLLATLPGAVLGLAWPAGRYRWTAWSAAPALTLGLTAVAMGWLQLAGLPQGPTAVLVGELVLAVGAVLGARTLTRRRRGRGPAISLGGALERPGYGRPARTSVDVALGRLGLPHLADLLGVAVPTTFTVAIGRLFLGGIAQPPGWDAMNHAFFTRRMLQTGSTAIADVCVTGSTQAHPSCSFYPLAANTLWAQTAALTGGRVGTAMLGWALVVAPVAMVVGVYTVTRLLGGRPMVAACAAAMPALLGPMWISLISGRITEQAAPCMAAGVAILVALALRDRHPVGFGALAGIASVGILVSHSYDVLFAGSLGMAVAAFLLVPFVWRRALAGALSAMVAGLLAVAPFLGSLLAAPGERGQVPPGYDTVSASFQFWVQDFNRYVLFGFPPPGTRWSLLEVPSITAALWVTLVALCAAPLCFVLRILRWARPWVVTGVLWTLVGAWTSYSTSPVSMTLSALWYGNRARLRNMIMPVYGLVALAGACAIGVVLYILVTWAIRRRGPVRQRHAAAVAAVTFAATLTAYGLQPSSWMPLHEDLLRRAPVGSAYQRTFRWLGEHTDPGAVVAYDRHVEFMTWSYAEYGAGILFGIPPLTASSKPEYAERWAAFSWLVDNKGAAPAGCLVRKYNIQYLAVGQRRVPGSGAHYSRARLARSPQVRLVHQDNGLRVFAVTDAGRACPGSP